MKEKPWNYLPIYHWQDQRIKKTIAFLVLMVFSITILHNILVSPRTHAHTYEVLDQQKETVTALLVASTAMSTVISTIPEDTATPSANQLAELSTYFLLILSVLYFEKYILAIIGAVVTSFLVPIACAFSILQIWFTQLSRKLAHLLWRFVAFAIALFMVIPISVWIVDSIEATYRDSIESTINAAIQVEQAIEETNANNDEKTLWQSIIDIISNAWDGVSNLLDAAKTILSRYIEAAAIKLVTSCGIPIIVLVVVTWMAKALLGTNIINTSADKIIPVLSVVDGKNTDNEKSLISYHILIHKTPPPSIAIEGGVVLCLRLFSSGSCGRLSIRLCTGAGFGSTVLFLSISPLPHLSSGP